MKKEKPAKVVEVDFQAEFDELKSLLQRTQADFVNYRRRNDEDKAKFVRLATSDFIEQLLPVMDNFALAAKHVPAELATNNWVVGVQAVEQQLEQILLTNGLERVETEGKTFDPNFQEAVGEVHQKGLGPGIIVSEEAPGYILGGKLIRPARVIVNKTHAGITK